MFNRTQKIDERVVREALEGLGNVRTAVTSMQPAIERACASATQNLEMASKIGEAFVALAQRVSTLEAVVLAQQHEILALRKMGSAGTVQ